jgi:hypothetical protein
MPCFFSFSLIKTYQMPHCCLAAIYYWINVATELLVWIVPFLNDSSKYVPQISPPVPDDLLNYLPHPLITLPVPPPLPTSPMPSGYFVPMLKPAMTLTFEPLVGKLRKITRGIYQTNIKHVHIY